MRDGLRFLALDGAVEVDLGHTEIAAAGREHLPDEPVIRQVLLDAVPNPAVIRLHRIGPQIDGELRLDPQQVAPLHRPVIRKLLALQQTINQGAAFVRVLVQHERSRLLRGGQRANHVQIGAADKHGIRADIGGLNAQLLQPAENQFVDLAAGASEQRGFQRGLGTVLVAAFPPRAAKKTTAEINDIFIVFAHSEAD